MSTHRSPALTKGGAAIPELEGAELLWVDKTQRKITIACGARHIMELDVKRLSPLPVAQARTGARSDRSLHSVEVAEAKRQVYGLAA
jgi:hypothetical protein